MEWVDGISLLFIFSKSILEILFSEKYFQEVKYEFILN
jgi:hypothetical protein